MSVTTKKPTKKSGGKSGRGKTNGGAVKKTSRSAHGCGARAMNPRHQKFCDEYLTDGNATRAYQAVYPTSKTYGAAAVRAAALLKIVNVKAYIEKRMAEMSGPKIAAASEILERLTAIARGESKASVVVVEGRGEGASQAREFIKSPDERERLKALELLGKYHAIFSDKLKIDAAPPSVLNNDVTE